MLEPYEIEVDENSPLTQEELDSIAEYAGRMGLNKEDAQKMIATQEGLYKRGHESAEMAYSSKVEHMKREMYSHPDFQEGRREATWTSINRAVQTFGNDKLIEAFKDPENGYNLEIAMFLKNIGDALGPEVLPGSGAATSAPVQARDSEEARLRRLYPDLYKD